MPKATATSIAMVFAVALTAGAFADKHEAANHKEMKLERFNAADTNKDGLLSHAEAMARVKEKFDSFDGNGDGYLELAELPKEMPLPEHMKKRMEHYKEKMNAHAEDHTDEKSGDMRKKMRKRLAEHGMKRGKFTRLKFVAKLDQDGDERVSLDEFSVRAIKRFKHHDLNGDGNISLAELEKAPKPHMMKKRQGKRKHARG